MGSGVLEHSDGRVQVRPGGRQQNWNELKLLEHLADRRRKHARRRGVSQEQAGEEMTLQPPLFNRRKRDTQACGYRSARATSTGKIGSASGCGRRPEFESQTSNSTRGCYCCLVRLRRAVAMVRGCGGQAGSRFNAGELRSSRPLFEWDWAVSGGVLKSDDTVDDECVRKRDARGDKRTGQVYRQRGPSSSRPINSVALGVSLSFEAFTQKDQTDERAA